jgi:hypoxanthine-DNA glycosylase
MKRTSFPPIVDDNSKILILGSMPGERSLQLNQYYGNPTNQFWRIISFITGDNFNTTYEAKKLLLLKNHIAIWDVLMHCEREGSLDVNISDEVPNDFNAFFLKYPKIKSVFLNGNKAAQIFSRYSLLMAGKIFTNLPSTSSANTSMTFDKKAQLWKTRILKYNE